MPPTHEGDLTGLRENSDNFGQAHEARHASRVGTMSEEEAQELSVIFLLFHHSLQGPYIHDVVQPPTCSGVEVWWNIPVNFHQTSTSGCGRVVEV